MSVLPIQLLNSIFNCGKLHINNNSTYRIIYSEYWGGRGRLRSPWLNQIFKYLTKNKVPITYKKIPNNL